MADWPNQWIFVVRHQKFALPKLGESEFDSVPTKPQWYTDQAKTNLILLILFTHLLTCLAENICRRREAAVFVILSLSQIGTNKNLMWKFRIGCVLLEAIRSRRSPSRNSHTASKGSAVARRRFPSWLDRVNIDWPVWPGVNWGRDSTVYCNIRNGNNPRRSAAGPRCPAVWIYFCLFSEVPRRKMKQYFVICMDRAKRFPSHDFVSFFICTRNSVISIIAFFTHTNSCSWLSANRWLCNSGDSQSLTRFGVLLEQENIRE